MAIQQDFFDKRQYERRAKGLGDVVGTPLEIEWGMEPSTDGETVYLPTPDFYEPWDEEVMVKAAFNHEVAHVMFDTDISAMYDFAERWSEQVDHPDPFDMIPRAAEHVVQTIEDHRIEYLFGELYYGARERFRDHFRKRLHGDHVHPPSNALHGLRCGMGNEMNTYSPVVHEYGSETAELFYEALKAVEGASVEMTIYQADQVMSEIVGWYTREIGESLAESPIADIYKEWKESDGKKRSEMEERVENEAKRHKRNFSDLRKLYHRMDEIEDSEIEGDDGVDIDDVLEGNDGDTSDWEGEGMDTIRELEVDDDIGEEEPGSNIDFEIVKQNPSGIAKGDVDRELVSRIKSELQSIYGKRMYRNGTYGERLDIDAVIRSEATPEPNFEWFQKPLLTTGFSVVVLLDTSWSMKGHRIDLCRDMGATLFTALEDMKSEGYDIGFEIMGYSGGDEEYEMLIQESTTSEEARKIDVYSKYPSTPTWAAVEYADQKLNREDGASFIILLTDGVPQSPDVDGEPIPFGRSVRYTREAIEGAVSPVFTVGIDIGLSPEEMSKTYGPYVNVESPEVATEVMQDFIRRRIRDQIYMS